MNNKIICKICNSEAVNQIFESKNQPLARYGAQNKKNSQINRGNLNIVLCRECGSIYNREFDLSRINYKSDSITESRIFLQILMNISKLRQKNWLIGIRY